MIIWKGKKTNFLIPIYIKNENLDWLFKQSEKSDRF